MVSNNGGCLKKIIGWTVVIVLVFIVAHACGFDLDPFSSDSHANGCDAPAAAGPVAHADSDDCDDLRNAALDPNWAAKQQQRFELVRGEPTTGLLFTRSPDSYTALSSGNDELSERAAAILSDARVAGVDPTHVETKIAARMRDSGILFGVLVINNVYVCGKNTSTGCYLGVPMILPEGAKLWVWTKGAGQVLVLSGRSSS